MTLIIGLLGPAGAGKSTIAEYLSTRYGAKRYSFAGPLKEMVGRALEFSDEQLYGTQAQKEAPDDRYGGKSARWFLQRIGTDGCRNTFGEDFWSDQLLARIERHKPELAVIEDVRFVNEAKAIRDFGKYRSDTRSQGAIWRLETPNRETTADQGHASEAQWRDAPYDCLVAPNERGIEHLYRLVDDLCRRYTIFPARPELPL